MEVFAGGVIRVTVRYVYHPFTEETLRQVFDAHGVVQISISQRADSLEAVVRLQSRHEAARALALHGCVIYEGSYLLDIQDVSPVAPSANCDIRELFDEIRYQLRKLSAMMHVSSPSTPSSREDITEELGLELDKNLTDVSPKVGAPVVCRTDQGIIAADPSSLAALTSTTCSMVDSSSDATLDVVPKLAASEERDEDLDLDTITLTPSTCLMDGLAHGRNGTIPTAVSLVLWTTSPSFTAPAEAAPALSQRPSSVLELDDVVPTRCSTLCFDDIEIGVLTSAFQLDVTLGNKQQGSMLRP
ncbi:hypothetical protein QYE76_032177 [Lolium multiflorum]|uniref:PTBP1-like RNA recognition motif 2 domain-containing protein n=1 Tax=Lolium multiflorum TaxID=4521 RepID=A0AAD8QWB7_LOLMU|nr:hypothetical protein QYE76_032177 [Lolium multiflorum]